MLSAASLVLCLDDRGMRKVSRIGETQHENRVLPKRRGYIMKHRDKTITQTTINLHQQASTTRIDYCTQSSMIHARPRSKTLEGTRCLPRNRPTQHCFDTAFAQIGKANKVDYKLTELRLGNYGSTVYVGDEETGETRQRRRNRRRRPKYTQVQTIT